MGHSVKLSCQGIAADTLGALPVKILYFIGTLYLTSQPSLQCVGIFIEPHESQHYMTHPRLQLYPEMLTAVTRATK